MRLKRADVIVLLISPDLLDTNFSDIVLEQSAAKHQAGALVIPILLRSIVQNNIPLLNYKDVQLLPHNGRPISQWKTQDDYIAAVAEGIGAAIEARFYAASTTAKSVQGKPASTTIRTESTLPIPRDYIYISDAKLEVLTRRDEVTTAWNRYQALDSTLAALRLAKKIGSTKSQKPYIEGRQMMRWGTIAWGKEQQFSAVFFFAQEGSSILLMVGSAYHLTDEPVMKFVFSPQRTGASGSTLPGIMSAIQFATDHQLPDWTRGIGKSSDFLFLAGFVRERYIERTGVEALPLHFPEQRLQFVARVLKRLPRPGEQQLQELLADPRLSVRDKSEIQQVLSDAREIVICSPLYVELDDKQ